MKREEFNKFYVLTGDLDHVVGQWCQQNHLKPPSRKGFEKLRRSFHKDLENVVRKTAEHSGSDLEVQFTNRKQFSWLTKEKNDKGFWIALDDVYIPIADFNIGMTRIYDKHGECQLGHGFRPETDADSIENQIKNCRTKYVNAGSPKRVVLADDGTFTGSTIADMLGRLRDVEIKVTEVCMAFATFEGKAKIEKVIEKESRRILYHVTQHPLCDTLMQAMHLENLTTYLALTTTLGLVAIYAGFRGTLTAGFEFKHEVWRSFLTTPLVLFLPGTLFYNFYPRYVLKKVVQHKVFKAMERLGSADEQNAKSLLLNLKESAFVNAQILPFLDYKSLPSYLIAIFFVVSVAYNNDPAIQTFVKYLLNVGSK